jgi:pimeloyl-ACP methyl ester carboxylesterase
VMGSPWRVFVLVSLCFAQGARGMTEQQRREYRDHLMQILPAAPSFAEWVKKTDALPPDFDALPRCDDLPDPLQCFDGRAVKSADDWPARRAEILDLYQKYDLGKFPPKPKLDHITVLSQTQGNGYFIRAVRLEFGPDDKGIMHVTLTVPDGDGPFPVLISPGYGWSSALRRGYISAAFAANDFQDDAAGLKTIYPDYDFGALTRRAWAAQMVVDYLESLPQVNAQQIAIFGYSRDGKMAAIAAAIDPRIAALVAGSTGVGGLMSWRDGGDRNFAESIESTTRSYPSWFAPQLRFFVGREDRLPVDGNLLAALIAPRACLIEYGNNDEVSQSWAMEHTFRSAKKVYDLLGKPDAIDTLHVPGFHGANDPEVCLDWLDIQFGRSSANWINDIQYPWDYEDWKSFSKETIDVSQYPEHKPGDFLTGVKSPADWESKAADVRKSVQWALGDEPPMLPPGSGRPLFLARLAASRATTQPSTNPGQVVPDLVNWVIQRHSNSFGWLEPEASATTSRRIEFGSDVRGDLYYPKNLAGGAKLPTVIWLHGYSASLGYMWVYHNDLHPILALVKAGYAVFAYDQAGFGSRISEVGPFMRRYPHWSQMGKLVEDVRTAVDALQHDSLVDRDHIFVFGYSLGGMVGIYSAALDDRIKGVVSIAGFTPMRTDTADKGRGGIARYCVQRPLVPKLGFFIGSESRIPYDFDEMIAAIAPRPVLVVEPQLDRDATQADVHDAVERARTVYALFNAADHLGLDEPWDYNRLPTKIQDDVIGWMSKNFLR